MELNPTFACNKVDAEHLLLCRIERRPPRLDLKNYLHLPIAQVRTPQAADYMTLLQEATA